MVPKDTVDRCIFLKYKRKVSSEYVSVVHETLKTVRKLYTRPEEFSISEKFSRNYSSKSCSNIPGAIDICLYGNSCMTTAVISVL